MGCEASLQSTAWRVPLSLAWVAWPLEHSWCPAAEQCGLGASVIAERGQGVILLLWVLTLVRRLLLCGCCPCGLPGTGPGLGALEASSQGS